MKRTLALALAIFLGLGLLSTSFSVAQDAIGGFTSWSGSYGTIDPDSDQCSKTEPIGPRMGGAMPRHGRQGQERRRQEAVARACRKVAAAGCAGGQFPSSQQAQQPQRTQNSN